MNVWYIFKTCFMLLFCCILLKKSDIAVGFIKQGFLSLVSIVRNPYPTQINFYVNSEVLPRLSAQGHRTVSAASKPSFPSVVGTYIQRQLRLTTSSCSDCPLYWAPHGERGLLADLDPETRDWLNDLAVPLWFLNAPHAGTRTQYEMTQR